MKRARLAACAAAITTLAAFAASLSGCSAASDPQETFAPSELISKMPAATGAVDEITWNLTAGEPTTLDPRNAADYSSGQVVANLCDYLLTIDENFEVKPNLADVMQSSPTEVVIDLRADAKFWDGNPVTAEDVAYSLQRAADPEASIVSYVFMAVESIDVTGPKQVTVRFSEPDASFVRSLSTIVGAVIEKSWAESAGDDVGTASGGLMCSGPYKLASWKSGSELTIETNPDYWNAERAPLAKTVKFTTITDVTAVTQALNAGEIDGSYELPASTVPTLSASAAGSLVFGPSMQSLSIWIAQSGGALDDPDLRAALQVAFDRDAIATGVFYGAASPSYTVVSESTWPAETKDLYSAAAQDVIDRRAYDPEAAKKLVEQSSYDGSPLTLAVQAGDDTLTKTAQIIQQQAKQAGIDIEIDTVSALLMTQASSDPAAREGMDLMLTTNFNSAPDPLELLMFTYMPDEVYNYVDFDDPTVTDQLQAARGEFDPEARAKLIIEALGPIEDADASIPLVETHTTTFLKKPLTGAITSFAYWSMPQMAFIGTAD